MYMRGIDDKMFNMADASKNYEYGGGFVELDYAGLANNRLVASALYNWIAPPSYDSGNAKFKAYSGLLRYYVGDWSAVNVALHGEFTHRAYTYREMGAGETTMTENIYSMLVDFGF